MSTTSTPIEWTDRTWNPCSGCSKISPGCARCYAETIAERFRGSVAFPNGFDLTLKPGKLVEPLGWRTPARIFVNSMSDLFHEGVPFDFVDAVFGIMAACPDHTFQVLTKRAERMLEWANQLQTDDDGWGVGHLGHRLLALVSEACTALPGYDQDEHGIFYDELANRVPDNAWPLPNVWLGVSVENDRFVGRIDDLREAPAVVRFVSFEPLLGHIDPAELNLDDIDWIIIGGESGSGARPLRLEWVRELADVGRAYGCAVFVKQLGTAWARENGARHKKGGEMSEWPEDLRIREFPTGKAVAL